MITIDLDKLSIQPGDKILDIGCGSGRHIGAIVQYSDVTVLGSDMSFDEILKARTRLRCDRQMGIQHSGQWELSVANVTCLPFKNNYFDLVLCSEVLEHIPDHTRAINEIIRVLRPGKTIAVTVPRFFPERVCKALSKEYFTTDQGHIRIYKKESLINRLEIAGACVWAVHHAHGIHTPYWWLKCLIGPNRNNAFPVNLYHRFLVWDIMKKPKFTRFLDRLFNPVMGKSLVIYAQKNNSPSLNKFP